MKIEKIEWISREGQEAELHLLQGQHTCTVFCQPCEYKEGDSVVGPLHAFMTSNVVLSYAEGVSLKRIDQDLYSYAGTARVLDPQLALVSANGFDIELDEVIPAGINVGDLVDFECRRLDLW